MKIVIMLAYIFVYLIMLFWEKICNPIRRINGFKVDKLHYYRDELNEYSPLINAKILGKDIFDKDVIVSMLMYLDNKTSSELLPHEKEFLEKKRFIFFDLKNHETTLYSNATLKVHIDDLIEKDMQNLALLESEYKGNTGHLNKVDCLTCLFFIINFYFLTGVYGKLPPNILKIVFISEVLLNITWIVIYMVSIYQNLIFKMHLTEEGMIYLEKLTSSKNFLKEYSMISKREIKEEKLWDSYIRNAIFFNLKGKLDDDAKKYYNQIIDKYKYKESFKLKSKKIKDCILSFILVFPWIVLLFVGNNNIEKMIANITFINTIINPFIFFFFISKSNPSSIKRK